MLNAVLSVLDVMPYYAVVVVKYVRVVANIIFAKMEKVHVIRCVNSAKICFVMIAMSLFWTIPLKRCATLVINCWRS